MKKLTNQQKQNLFNAASVVLKERGWSNLQLGNMTVWGIPPTGLPGCQKSAEAANFHLDKMTGEWTYTCR